MVAVKNLPGYNIQVGWWALYKQLFLPKNTIMNPCFGVANSVAPLLRFVIQYSDKMVAKDDPVVDLVEEEEEEEVA